MRARRITAIAFAAVVTAGCGMGLLPGDPMVPEGHRQWIVSVENGSREPARVMVAEDEAAMGELMGTADPPQVAAHSTEDVTLTVPPDQNWAVFVNPSAMRGPLLLAMDVPAEFEGRLPITIHIDATGEPSFSHVGELPGWFGQ